MSSEQPGIVLLGRGKDSMNFPCWIHEDTVSGHRYLSYEPEVWFLRARHIEVLKSLGKEVPQDKAESLAIEA